LLAPVVDQVIVCDRRGEPRGNKADQRDADNHSHRLLTGDLRAAYHGSTDRLTLQKLTRTYMNIVEDSTRAMLRLKSLYRARAIRGTGHARLALHRTSRFNCAHLQRSHIRAATLSCQRAADGWLVSVRRTRR
jgi:hypothetical protein